MGIGYNEPDFFQAPGFEVGKQFRIGGCGFFVHRFNGQDVPFAFHSNTTYDSNRHVFDTAVVADFFIQSIHPQDGLGSFNFPIAKGFHLFIQIFRNDRYLAAGDGFNAQRLGQFFDFSGGYAVNIGFLNDI